MIKNQVRLTPINNKLFMSFKYFLIVSFIGCFALNLFAQEQLTPLPISDHYKSVKKPNLKKSNKKPVELPFIDDFSTTNVYPDSNLWEDQYVFVNKFMAVNPPTIGVASFDGLNDEGQPYQGFSVDNAPCDTLTSTTINLASFTTDNSIYFNFFYQAGGYADYPNPNDTLILEFKYETGWDTIWKVTQEDEILRDFEQVSIKVSDSAKYLIPNFQFRFRNYARPAGHNDFWHIDYVRLEQGAPRTNFNDQAFVEIPTSIIEPYTQMTFEQFLFQQDTSKNKDNNFLHSFKVRNLENEAVPVSYFYEINLPSLGTNLFTTNPLALNVPSNSFFDQALTLKPFAIDTVSDDNKENYNIIPFAAIEDTVKLDIEYFIETSNDVRRENDTIKRSYNFSNQLAYDDGIADFAYAVNGESAEFAQRYIVYERDDIFGLMIHFARIENNQSNRLFSIKIWDKIEGVDGSDTTVLIYPERNPLDPYAEPDLLNVQYPNQYNHSGFRLYCFDNQISVSDTFYVGIQQSGDVGILVGFDKNTEAGNQNLFYNLFNEWTPSTLNGSVMMRPVFDESPDDCFVDWVNAPSYAVLSDEFEIYPNPVSDNLSISFNKINKVNSIEILDVAGKLIENFNGYVNQVNVGNMPNGIYFIRLTVGGKTGIKKFIKSN